METEQTNLRRPVQVNKLEEDKESNSFSAQWVDGNFTFHKVELPKATQLSPEIVTGVCAQKGWQSVCDGAIGYCHENPEDCLETQFSKDCKKSHLLQISEALCKKSKKKKRYRWCAQAQQQINIFTTSYQSGYLMRCIVTIQGYQIIHLMEFFQ